jgi:hypothetical protein
MRLLAGNKQQQGWLSLDHNSCYGNYTELVRYVDGLFTAFVRLKEPIKDECEALRFRCAKDMFRLKQSLANIKPIKRAEPKDNL